MSVQPGDPDPTDPNGDCPATDDGYQCTRWADHAGQHVAGAKAFVAHVWRSS